MFNENIFESELNSRDAIDTIFPFLSFYSLDFDINSSIHVDSPSGHSVCLFGKPKCYAFALSSNPIIKKPPFVRWQNNKNMIEERKKKQLECEKRIFNESECVKNCLEFGFSVSRVENQDK